MAYFPVTDFVVLQFLMEHFAKTAACENLPTLASLLVCVRRLLFPCFLGREELLGFVFSCGSAAENTSLISSLHRTQHQPTATFSRPILTLKKLLLGQALSFINFVHRYHSSVCLCVFVCEKERWSRMFSWVFVFLVLNHERIIPWHIWWSCH